MNKWRKRHEGKKAALKDINKQMKGFKEAEETWKAWKAKL